MVDSDGAAGLTPITAALATAMPVTVNLLMRRAGFVVRIQKFWLVESARKASCTGSPAVKVGCLVGRRSVT